MTLLDAAGTGRLGEELARLFLAGCGYRCLARRYRRGRGEVDLVVARPGELVFVEVKTRGPGRWGSARAAVTRDKLRRLRSAARAWLAENPASRDLRLRVDVVAVDLDGEGRGLVLVHYRGVG